jgi:hypothetical protein
MATVRIQVRRGTATQWTTVNPVLAAGEIGLESDTRKIKFGDGTTAWSSLGYLNIGDIDEVTQDAINAALTMGTGLTKVYDDNANTITLSVDTSTISTKTYVDNTVSNHSSDTTNIHGIADTSALATKTYADNAASAAQTAAETYADNAASTAQSAAEAYADALTTDDVSEGSTNKYFTDERAQDAVGNSLGTGLSYNDTTGAISVTTNTYDAYGAAASAQNSAEGYADSAVSTHNSSTTNVHGISNTANLATKTYADNAASAAQTAAESYADGLAPNYDAAGTAASAVSAHELDTTNIHGITDTSKLVTTDGSQTLTNKTITSPLGIVKSDVGLGNVDNTSDANKPISSATQTALNAKAPLASPSLTGTPTAPTATSGTNNTQIATTAYVDSAVAGIVDSAPETLNTLNELAAALGDDANFATSVSNSIGSKVAKSGDTMTGALTLSGAPTADLHASTKKYVDDSTSSAQSSAESYADSAISTHNSDTTNVHGITDTSALATKTYADNAASTAESNANNYTDGEISTEVSNRNSAITSAISTEVTNRNNAISSSASTTESNANSYTDSAISTEVTNRNSAISSAVSNAISTEVTNRNNAIATAKGEAISTSESYTDTQINALTTSDIEEGTNLYYTDERAQDAIGLNLGTGLSYNDTTGAISNSGVTAFNTRTGNVTLSGSDVNTALGYTAADAAALSGFQTSTAQDITNAITTAENYTDTVVGALTTTDIPEGTRLYYTQERVQDEINNTIIGGTGIDATYVDNGSNSGTLTLDIDSTVVTLEGTQTLTNKTLTSPVINSPTGITKSDVGLSNVNNTSDANKPISTATQSALDLKAPLESPTFTGTVTLPAGTVTSGMILDGTIVNTDINSSAAIDYSKLNLTGNIVNADISSSAAIDLSKLSTNPLARANHTGTQSASTISDFNTQVRTSRLDQMSAPTAAVSMNNQIITDVATPVSDNDAANKAYVDAAVNNINIHESVVAATTGNVNLTNAVDNNKVLDGVTLSTGNRILVKNQNTASQNGIYIVAANGAPTRATDYNAAGEVSAGDFIFVKGGTVNGNTGWIQTADVTTVGTDPLSFTQFSGAGTYTAGTGLALSGTTFSIDTGTTVDISTTQTLTNKTLTSPTLTTPALGTPASGVMTNVTGLPLTTGVTGTLPVANGGTGITSFGTGIATALGTNVGTAGSPVVNGGVLGTPSSGTLTNATGLPISTGVSGLGTGVATALATNVGTAGSPVVNGGVLGTPSSGTLTNATGLPVSGITASTTTALGVGSIELGHATDTTLSRSSAGVLAVEGVVIPSISSANTLTNKSLSTTTTNFVDATDATKKLNITTSGNTTNITGTVATSFTTAKTLTLPDATDTLVGRATTDTLTNKTLSSPTITTTGTSPTFIAISGSTTAGYSTDGITWTTTTVGSSALNAIAFGANKFVASAASYSGNNLAYGNGKFVTPAYTASTVINYSTDGITWSSTNTPTPATQSSAAFYSTDGITWAISTLPSNQQWSSVAFGNGVFVAATLGFNTTAASSTDGITWTLRTLATSGLEYSISYGTRFLLLGGQSQSSTDGITWSTIASLTGQWQNAAYGNSTYVAIKSGLGNVLATTGAAYSTDGLTWNTATLPSSLQWSSVIFGNGKFVAMASGPTTTAAYSTNGITWTVTTMPGSQSWKSVAYGATPVTFTQTLPSTSNDTLVGRATTDTLTNKSLSTTTTNFVDATDATKKLNITTSGNTTAITGTIAAAFTTAKTLTLPDATDTLVGKATTDVLTNKSLSTTTTNFIDATDATKKLNITTSGNTTNITGTIAAAFTTAKTLTLPDATDTLVGRATTDTLTNKSLSTTTTNFIDATDATKKLNITTSGNTTAVTGTLAAAFTTAKTLTLPDATDTLIGRATTDTLTNKTLTSPVISTISNTGTLTLPTSTDTLVGRATTDTLTNKTLGSTLSYTLSVNTATAVDTIALSAFTSVKYLLSIKQGTKIRTSEIHVQTDGTSVDYVEYGTINTGTAITGLAVAAAVSSTNMVLNITITDAATTNATIKLFKVVM